MFYNLLGFLFVFYTIFYLIKMYSTFIVVYSVYIKKTKTFETVFENSPIQNKWHLLINTIEIIIFTAVFIYSSIHFFSL